MITKKLVALVVGVAFLVGGCATTGADPNYLARLDAQKSVDTVRAQAELERAKADTARMVALQKIGETGDTQARQMAVMALAVIGNGGGSSNAFNTQLQQMPTPPDSGSDKALKWASILAGPLTMVATGYFGYKLGVAQSNNQAASTIASYNTFGSMANSGYSAISNTASAGFASNGVLAGYIQAPQPNMTLNGTGVIGAGNYTANSNNRNCNGGNGAPGGSGAPGGNGGTGTTTGGAGASGGAGAGGGVGGLATC